MTAQINFALNHMAAPRLTFDVSTALLDAIQKSDAVAGIDQLVYPQGYLPAVLARTDLDGMIPDRDIVTGPARPSSTR